MNPFKLKYLKYPQISTNLNLLSVCPMVTKFVFHCDVCIFDNFYDIKNINSKVDFDETQNID